MLESLTIFSPGGLIYYQYVANPSLFVATKNKSAGKGGVQGTSSVDDTASNINNPASTNCSDAFTENQINQILINKIFLHPATSIPNSTNNYHIEDGVTFVWTNEKITSRKEHISKMKRTKDDTLSLLWGRFVVVAIYPDIVFDGPRAYLQKWATELVTNVCTEYSYLLDAEERRYQEGEKKIDDDIEDGMLFVRPNPSLFDKTFRLLLKSSKANGGSSGAGSSSRSIDVDGCQNDDSDFYDNVAAGNKDQFQIIKEKGADGKIHTRIVLNDTALTSGSSHLPQHMLTNDDTYSNDDSNNADDPFRSNAADRLLKLSQLQGKQQIPAKKKVSTGTGGKEKRNWHDGTAKVTEKAMAELDYSANDGGTSTDAYQRALREARAAYLPTDDDLVVGGDPTVAKEDDASVTQTSSFFSNLFQTLTLQNKVLTVADLQGPCQQLKQLLQSKNVANTIASEISASVLQQLTGKTLKAFYSIDTAIQQAVETSIERIVFHTNYDLLRNILTKKELVSKSGIMSRFGTSSTKVELERKHRPYVISVMGINGIGKTTTIAKLAYYIQQRTAGTANPLRPMLVACDTFRSGAVEQLKIHADCLNIPFYSQGYSKDPSAVAAQAIQSTTQSNIAIATNTTTTTKNKLEYIDVLLIDTAGRMQNNVPLMKALNKLVIENQPDCCLLVCEALVGHDGLNQFDMFSKAAGGTGRRSNNMRSSTNGGIHGLILTKFDTVDTKVGASITLTYETSTPIVFVGTGQKYHHLAKLTPNTIVSSLFSTKTTNTK